MAPGDRSPAINEALATIAGGKLASDATVLGLVRERVGCLRCADGFLLDGFPRTEAQAVALDGLLAAEDLALDAALCFDLDEDRIVTRLAGRRVCVGCRRIYHVEANRPSVAGVCDACGAMIVPRDDDRPDVVRVRMRQHAVTSPPLAAYYAMRGLLVTVDASGTPDEVFARTAAALGVVQIR
jgi:adenylate kinase